MPGQGTLVRGSNTYGESRWIAVPVLVAEHGQGGAHAVLLPTPPLGCSRLHWAFRIVLPNVYAQDALLAEQVWYLFSLRRSCDPYG